MPYFLPVRPGLPSTPGATHTGSGWAFSVFTEAEREFRRLVSLLGNVFQQGKRSEGNPHGKGKEKERPTEREAVESYMKLRSLDQARTFLFDIPSQDRTSLLKLSTLEDIPSSSSKSVTEILIQDLIDCVSSRRPEDYQQAILDVFDLAISSTHQIAVSDKQALDLYHSLPHGFNSQHYTTAMITRVFEAMLNDSDSRFPIHLPFLTTSYQHLIATMTAQPSIAQDRATWALLCLIERLSRLVSQPRTAQMKTVQNPEGVVLEVLANVAGAGVIPESVAAAALASATRALSTSTPTGRAEVIRVAALDAVVSTCFRRGWHARAEGLLCYVLSTGMGGPVLNGKPQVRGVQHNQPLPDPARARPVSSMMADCLQHTMTKLLTFPTPADIEITSNLLPALVEAFNSQSELAPRVPGLVKAYTTATSTSQHEVSLNTAANLYHRLKALEVDLADRIPPRDAQTRLLQTYLQSGQPEHAKTLIRDILEYDALVHDAQGEMGAVDEMETDFVLGVVTAKDGQSLQEIWRRAQEGWSGYSRRTICGSRTILNAVAKQFTRRARDIDPSLGEFARRMVRTFKDIHIPSSTPPSEDVALFNQACSSLGYNDLYHTPRLVVTQSRSMIPADITTHPVCPKLSDLRLLRDKMGLSCSLEERKSAARQIIKSLRDNESLGVPPGSPLDVQLRTRAAEIALDVTWPPDVWRSLLKDKQSARWSRDLRRRISEMTFDRWMLGELPHGYCHQTLRHLRSPLARVMKRESEKTG
ncbi:hypothetical protein FRB90_007488 [Tulasnella sp. 427]|nr:hypothetical protein FRB90_007488 [Tulasnella sp. 427]